jgi:hypothetical protein
MGVMGNAYRTLRGKRDWTIPVYTSKGGGRKILKPISEVSPVLN